MNNAFLSAYKKGRKAYRDNGEGAICPYPEKRGGKFGHIITFSRAFQKYWREGFEDEKANLPMRYPPNNGVNPTPTAAHCDDGAQRGDAG